jgi:hypothetical protein
MSGSTAGLPPQAQHAVTIGLDPGRFRFSLWRNVSITLWTAQATLDAAERVLRLSRQLNRDFPQGRSQVMIVSAGTAAPEGRASELLTEIYDPRVSRIVCIAAVLEGSGFWASGIRSRMTNMRMAAGNAMMLRVHETVDDVATWLPAEHAERTGTKLSPDELKTVLTSVRALGTLDEK